MSTTNSRILDTVLKRGVLLSTTVSFWRAHKHLKPEDIGLKPEQVNDRLYSLGHKKLVPAEELAPFSLVESRVTALVKAHSFPFMHGVGRYVPNAALSKVIDGLAIAKKDFWQAFKEFHSRYKDIRRAAQLEWMKAAQELSTEPHLLIEAIDKAYPQPDQLEEYFNISWGFFQIAFPEEIDEGVLISESAEVLAARQEAARTAKKQMLDGVGGFVNGCVNQMREDLISLVSEMQESIRTGKNGVHQKTLNRLESFIGQYRLLNFAGDSELEQAMQQFSAAYLTQPAEHYRNNASDQQRLVAGLGALRQVAADMIRAGTENVLADFSKLGARKVHLGKHQPIATDAGKQVAVGEEVPA